MNNIIGAALLIGMAVIVVSISVCAPSILSDNNTFMSNFVNHELLNILGVIVAITAASASNVHLELRRLEAEYKFKDGFEQTRREVKRGAFALVTLFGAAFLLVAAKPVVAINQNIQALINGASAFILFWNILVLWALLGLAFKVGPIFFDEDE